MFSFIHIIIFNKVIAFIAILRSKFLFEDLKSWVKLVQLEYSAFDENLINTN